MADELTNVYVRDEWYKWLPATVVDFDSGNDHVQVRIEEPSHWEETEHFIKEEAVNAVIGKEVWVDLHEYRDNRLPIRSDATEVRDAAELPHLHEAAILYLLKERHLQKKPYTRVGEIIVAMNPCQWIKELYTVDMQRMYAKRFVWQGTYTQVDHDIVLTWKVSQHV